MDATARLLLHDAMERVAANPTASLGWHRLLACFETIDDAALRHAVCAGLMAIVPARGIGGFLRATFLAGVTGEEGHIADAAQALQQIRPLDPERVMAFAAFEWGRALVHAPDRTRFVASLRAACLPELMRLAGLHLARRADAPLRPRAIGSLHRFAVLAPFIGPAGHAPSALALAHARLLRQLGRAVHVFSAQELLMPDMPQYLGNMGRVTTPAPVLDALAASLPEGVQMTLGDAGFSLTRRWQDMLDAVAAFDPDLVLFVGLYSPSVAPLYAARPVLGLCVHSVAPMAPVDVWLTAAAELAGPAPTPWMPALPPAWGHHHPFRIAADPPSAVAPCRRQLGLAQDDVVLVTVGARLGQEIAGDWAARMAALLAPPSRLVWLLVGGAGDVPEALRDVDPARLRCLAHRHDLRAVLRCCDIYLNPPRLGGGFSVAEAMAEALPAIAFAGSDGGNKLGDHAVETTEAYFARLRALIDRPDMRMAAGAAMRDLFDATLDLARSSPSLLEAAGVARDLFQIRCAASSAAPMIFQPANG
jgi:hypothetical protein